MTPQCLDRDLQVGAAGLARGQESSGGGANRGLCGCCGCPSVGVILRISSCAWLLTTSQEPLTPLLEFMFRVFRVPYSIVR